MVVQLEDLVTVVVSVTEVFMVVLDIHHFFGGGFFPGFVAGALLSPGFGYGGYGYPYYSDYSYYTGYQQDPYYSYNTY